MTETQSSLEWNARFRHPTFAENFQSPGVPLVPLINKKPN